MRTAGQSSRAQPALMARVEGKGMKLFLRWMARER
jgi:hypothetical protein